MSVPTPGAASTPPFNPHNPLIAETPVSLRAAVGPFNGVPSLVVTMQHPAGETVAVISDPENADRWLKVLATGVAQLKQLLGTALVVAPANTPLPPLAATLPGFPGSTGPVAP